MMIPSFVHLLHVKAEGLQTAARMLRGIGTVREADAVFTVPGQRIMRTPSA